MKCAICGENAIKTISDKRPAKYRDEIVEVERELSRCESCKNEFVTPEQLRQNVRAVKSEIRRKHGLLLPDRIAQIREKTLGLTQADLEEVLGAPPKTVVRWESGKVIQSNAQDNMLRLLERDPSMVQKLREIQKTKARQQQDYARSHKPKAVAAAGHTVGA